MQNGVAASRWYRPIALGLSALVVAWGAATFAAAASGLFGQFWGVDIGHYLDGTRRWLETGSPYLPSEVAAPFEFQPLTFLHPPVALLLFLPFLVLPIVLWWLIPLGVVAAVVVGWRPLPWTWPLLAAAIAYPRFHAAVIVGNSDLWVWAGVAAGIKFGWPALVIVVKPSLIFLAAAGAGHRSWLVGLPVLALACLPFGMLWIEWVSVVLNSPGDFTYSLANVPYLIAPAVAWAGRQRG